jgi:alkanesulfonate monooxygenase SsuD/methylene tetrahydromethanopterin reductase-like flavin-dependent oxidoreductase (luciferase family)
MRFGLFCSPKADSKDLGPETGQGFRDYLDFNSHVLAYADKAGATEEHALFGTPDEITSMLEALQNNGVDYVLLTIAGGKEQLRRFAREDHGSLFICARSPRGGMT